MKEILVDERGRATGVAYFDEHDRLQEQPADVVVVSCGATESARLLLLSKSRLFPNGLGNRHDWVGRNLTGHTYTGAVGLFEQEIYDDIGPGVCVSVCDYNHGTPGLVGGGMLANEFIRLPYQFVDRPPPGVPSWGKGAQGLHAPVLPAQHPRVRARRRTCRPGTAACSSTRR